MTTLPEDRRQRVRNYVVDNAGRGREHAVALARAEWDRVAALLHGVSEDEARTPPAAGEWSVAQTVQHLRLSLQYLHQRVVAMSSGDAFPDPPYVTGRLPDEPPPGDSGPAFAALRGDLLTAVENFLGVAQAAEPERNLELTAAHAVFGPYNWVQWVVHSSVHARDHIGQIERTLAAVRERGAVMTDVPALSDVEGVIAYLKAQSALGLDNVRRLVRGETDAILAQVEGLSEEEGNFKPGPEEFSALEVLQHLDTSFARSQDRLSTLSSGRPWSPAPGAPAASPGAIAADVPQTFVEARRVFAEGSDAVMAILDTADGTKGLELTVRHPGYGEFTWLEWALYSHHVHTHDHTGQLAQIRALL